MTDKTNQTDESDRNNRSPMSEKQNGREAFHRELCSLLGDLSISLGLDPVEMFLEHGKAKALGDRCEDMLSQVVAQHHEDRATLPEHLIDSWWERLGSQGHVRHIERSELADAMLDAALLAIGLPAEERRALYGPSDCGHGLLEVPALLHSLECMAARSDEVGMGGNAAIARQAAGVILSMQREIDERKYSETAICDACDGSGVGVADTLCGKCDGSGGIPRDAVAAQFARVTRNALRRTSEHEINDRLAPEACRHNCGDDEFPITVTRFGSEPLAVEGDRAIRITEGDRIIAEGRVTFKPQEPGEWSAAITDPSVTSAGTARQIAVGGEVYDIDPDQPVPNKGKIFRIERGDLTVDGKIHHFEDCAAFIPASEWTYPKAKVHHLSADPQDMHLHGAWADLAAQAAREGAAGARSRAFVFGERGPELISPDSRPWFRYGLALLLLCAVLVGSGLALR